MRCASPTMQACSWREPMNDEPVADRTRLEQLLARKAELRIERQAVQQEITELRTADLELPAADRVRHRGHRSYIGGGDPERWYGIGRRQFHFLVSEGLQTSDRFLDIACGSLRLGQYLIPYLDAGNYFGIDGEQSLIDAGLDYELLYDLAARKRPSFAANYEFNFDFVGGTVDVAFAQSLFTHLTAEDISLCFRSLHAIADSTTRFFFTFFEGDSSQNTGESHANLRWEYSVDEIAALAGDAGWTVEHRGDWSHEADQQMAVATKG